MNIRSFYPSGKKLTYHWVIVAVLIFTICVITVYDSALIFRITTTLNFNSSRQDDVVRFKEYLIKNHISPQLNLQAITVHEHQLSIDAYVTDTSSFKSYLLNKVSNFNALDIEKVAEPAYNILVKKLYQHIITLKIKAARLEEMDIVQAVTLTPNASDKKQRDILLFVKSYMKKPEKSFVIIPDNLAVRDEQVTDFIKRFNNYQYKRQNLIGTNQTNSSVFRSAQNDLSNTRAKLDQLIENKLTEFKIKPGITNKLTPESSALNGSLLKINNQIKEEQYKIDSIQALKTNGLSKKANMPPVISSPVFQIKETFIWNLQNALAVVGLVLSGLLLLLYSSSLISRSFANKAFNREPDFKMVTKIPVKDYNAGANHELFRTATRNLTSLISATAGVKIISLVTPDSGLDCSVLSFSLLHQLQPNLKSIIVDFDFENSFIDSIKVRHIGLYNYLNSQVKTETLIKPSIKFPNTEIIPAGQVPDNELLYYINEKDADKRSSPADVTYQSNKLKWLVEELSKGYSYILFQVPDYEYTENNTLQSLSDVVISITQEPKFLKVSFAAKRKS